MNHVLQFTVSLNLVSLVIGQSRCALIGCKDSKMIIQLSHDVIGCDESNSGVNYSEF